MQKGGPVDMEEDSPPEDVAEELQQLQAAREQLQVCLQFRQCICLPCADQKQ